jgi:predicted esterase
MNRYFRRLADGVFDLEDLRARTDQLAAFIARAAETYDFDPANVIGVGYSNGANVAASLLLTHPGILAGAILFHAQVPLKPDELPNLSGVPVFMSGGRLDTLVPAAETERLGALLRMAGANLTVHWANGGHNLNAQEVDAARRWLSIVTNVE